MLWNGLCLLIHGSKFLSSGWKHRLISTRILPQTACHISHNLNLNLNFNNTKPLHMSLFLHWWYKSWQNCPFGACYVFLSWPTLLEVQRNSRINTMLKCPMLVKNCATRLKLDPSDVVLNTEIDNNLCVSVYGILMTWGIVCHIHLICRTNAICYQGLTDGIPMVVRCWWLFSIQFNSI